MQMMNFQAKKKRNKEKFHRKKRENTLNPFVELFEIEMWIITRVSQFVHCNELILEMNCNTHHSKADRCFWMKHSVQLPVKTIRRVALCALYKQSNPKRFCLECICELALLSNEECVGARLCSRPFSLNGTSKFISMFRARTRMSKRKVAWVKRTEVQRTLIGVTCPT